MQSQTFANVVTHDGRLEVRPTHLGVNNGNSNIENRQNTSILCGVKHEDYVNLYVKNIEWKHCHSYESMKKKENLVAC